MEVLGLAVKDTATGGGRYLGVGIFYHVVVQAVLLSISELWDVSEVMTRTVEGTHISFLRHITVNRVWINTYGTWETLEAGKVLRSSGIQTSTTYINHRQVTVVQRVALIPIFECFTR